MGRVDTFSGEGRRGTGAGRHSPTSAPRSLSKPTTSKLEAKQANRRFAQSKPEAPTPSIWGALPNAAGCTCGPRRERALRTLLQIHRYRAVVHLLGVRTYTCHLAVSATRVVAFPFGVGARASSEHASTSRLAVSNYRIGSRQRMRRAPLLSGIAR